MQFLDKKSPGGKKIFIQNVQNKNIFEIFKMFKNKFKVKFDTKTNLNMQNSMLVSILLALNKNSYPFWQIWFKKLQLSV